MNIFRKRPNIEDLSDAGLVVASLGGDRDAFGSIVTRYQGLLCSLAYSSVGDLKYSEDIAQEAFVEAWKKLDTLRDPEKVKPWLCGILRFKVSRHHRKEARQPVKNADELNEQGDYETEQTSLEDGAIREQEHTLLWQTLEKLPENYRTPLILFYREQCSVESVAQELDLSQGAAKQRLSRGRKLLQEAMVTFVENTLVKSKPGAVFTIAVLATIASIAPPAKAATIGAGAVKAGSALKWSSFLVVLASFSGVVSAFFSLRANLDQSRTQRERHKAIKSVALFLLLAFVFVAGMFLLKHLGLSSKEHAGYYAVASQFLVFAFTASYLILLVSVLRGVPKLRAQERKLHPSAFLASTDQPVSSCREYKSCYSLFGAPIIHFKLGMAEEGDKPAYGWIAGGDRAYGLLFAWGGFAVAPVSVGIVSVGLIGVGAIGLGVVGIGTVAFGVIAFGASAIAYKAYGSMSSIGWESAWSGGFAIAQEAAIGSVAFAKHVNNELAAGIVNITALSHSYLWVLGAIAILVITPAVWHSNKVRKRMQKKSD